MEKASSENGLRTFDVLAVVNESGKGSVKLEKLQKCGGLRLGLADDGESAGNGCANTDNVLKVFDGKLGRACEGQTITGSCLLKLIGADFACL